MALGCGDVMAHSVVISINTERLAHFYKVFDTYGLNHPTHIEGCVDEKLTPPMRCSMSHRMCVEYAKQHDWPYILIFEDDAYPCDNILNILPQYLKRIPNDTKICILGFTFVRQAQDFSHVFNKVQSKTIAGSHAYIIFKSAYDDYITYMQNLKHLADWGMWQNVGKKQSYVINYPLFIQVAPELDSYRRISAKKKNCFGYIQFPDRMRVQNFTYKKFVEQKG